MNYYRVAAKTPFNRSVLLYKSNDDFDFGSIVIIPLGKREIKGFVLERTSEKSAQEETHLNTIKEIKSRDEQAASLLKEDFELLQWMSLYYYYPIGMLIFSVLPKTLKRPRKLKKIEGKKEDDGINFTDDQKEVFNSLVKKINKGFSKSLIHGVTGSGKTLIYLRLINQSLSLGQSVIFMLPEINLTPQFLDVFSKATNADIYTYNSALSESDKFGLWKLLNHDTKPKIIIGVRSSIFLPVKNLGLIIVDEEHDQSFKQDDRCSYHARDVAIKKASLQNIPIILGSATPSVESYANFSKTESYFTLKSRPSFSSLPDIELIDMRESISKSDLNWPLKEKSVAMIKDSLSKGEQVLIYLNKIGYASFVQCRSCGHQFECPNCYTNLRVHKEKHILSCHVCDFNDAYPEACPACGNMNLLNKGYGTEKIKEVLESILPDKKIERFDREEIKNMKKLQERLDDFSQGKIDVLVGTQMMSKGHNFKNVKFVLIMGIDSQLNFPDFRATERVYQALFQVSGRAGRFESGGKVAIQTLCPDNKIFSYILDQSFDDFYRDELNMRELCQNPPYQKIAVISLTAKSKEKLIHFSSIYREFVDQVVKKYFNRIEVLGPRPALIEKRVNKFTWISLIKSPDINSLHNFLQTFSKEFSSSTNIDIKIDVDPIFID